MLSLLHRSLMTHVHDYQHGTEHGKLPYVKNAPVWLINEHERKKGLHIDQPRCGPCFVSLTSPFTVVSGNFINYEPVEPHNALPRDTYSLFFLCCERCRRRSGTDRGRIVDVYGSAFLITHSLHIRVSESIRQQISSIQ